MISIIVPIYNTGLFLAECIASILHQTYKDFELLLIDDGSTDNSLDICKQFALRDSRVKVYQKSNSGVSSTRNYGINIASGEYISFCDSDDIIDELLYETLYKIMIEKQVDRVCAGYAYLYGSDLVPCKERVADGKYDAKEILPRMLDDGTLSGVLFSGVNNSLYKREIINEFNIRFDENIKYNEDSLFSIQYMCHSSSIYSIQSKKYYHYRQHVNSITKKRTVGDKYAPFREKLVSLGLEDMDFSLQMRRRYITEALWEILDTGKKEEFGRALKRIKAIVTSSNVRENINTIDIKALNKYKAVYYWLMKHKSCLLLLTITRWIVPVLEKHISR